MERILADLRLEVEKLAHAGRLKSLSGSQRAPGASTHTQGRAFVDFTNFDVLGISGSRVTQRAVHQAIESIGLSSSASRVSSGTTGYHTACEQRLSQFFGQESALLFSSKNQAVLSLVTGLLSERDWVFFEDLTQSPVADAAYLINCPATPFSVSNLEALDAELARAASATQKMVFIEGVGGLTGVKAPLPLISAIARKHGAALVVDESFAVGTLGQRGAGCFDADRADIGLEVFALYCDLSLAVAGYGAALTGPAVVKSALVNRSRAVAFEVPLPPHIAAGVTAAIDVIEIALLSRASIGDLCTKLGLGLKGLGFVVLECAGPIVSCLMRENSEAVEVIRGLLERGFLAEAFPLPSSFRERAILRFIVTAQHSEVQVQALLQSLSDIRDRVVKGR